MIQLSQLDFDSREDLDISLARDIASALQNAIAERGTAAVALSGGRTPFGMFQQLRQIRIDWSKVWITLVDDRWLPVDHQDSNERVLRESLLLHAVAAANFVSLKSTASRPEDGLAEIEARLQQIPQPFDIVVLGMGEDCHTASLFPCAAELESAMARDNPQRVAALNPVTAPYARISLTLACIAAARQAIVHITGDKKKALFAEAMHADADKKTPIRRVLEAMPTPSRVYWAP